MTRRHRHPPTTGRAHYARRLAGGRVSYPLADMRPGDWCDVPTAWRGRVSVASAVTHHQDRTPHACRFGTYITDTGTRIICIGPQQALAGNAAQQTTAKETTA